MKHHITLLLLLMIISYHSVDPLSNTPRWTHTDTDAQSDGASTAW